MAIMRIVIVLILAVMPSMATPVEQKALNDACQLTGHLRNPDQTSFAIKVEDALFSAPLTMDVKSWWGVAQGNPVRMTSLVELRIGGVTVKIPYKAYAALGNPLISGGISLTYREDEIYLNICGGEGSAAYLARFVVINGKLTRREVILTESPDAKPDVMAFD